MLAMLIVEDTPEALTLLRGYLTREFPYARIDTAEDIAEAERRIEDAHGQSVAYKIAILDFLFGPPARNCPSNAPPTAAPTATTPAVGPAVTPPPGFSTTSSPASAGTCST